MTCAVPCADIQLKFSWGVVRLHAPVMRVVAEDPDDHLRIMDFAMVRVKDGFRLGDPFKDWLQSVYRSCAGDTIEFVPCHPWQEEPGETYADVYAHMKFRARRRSKEEGVVDTFMRSDVLEYGCDKFMRVLDFKTAVSVWSGGESSFLTCGTDVFRGPFMRRGITRLVTQGVEFMYGVALADTALIEPPVPVNPVYVCLLEEFLDSDAVEYGRQEAFVPFSELYNAFVVYVSIDTPLPLSFFRDTFARRKLRKRVMTTQQYWRGMETMGPVQYVFGIDLSRTNVALETFLASEAVQCGRDLFVPVTEFQKAFGGPIESAHAADTKRTFTRRGITRMRTCRRWRGQRYGPTQFLLGVDLATYPLLEAFLSSDAVTFGPNAWTEFGAFNAAAVAFAELHGHPRPTYSLADFQKAYAAFNIYPILLKRSVDQTNHQLTNMSLFLVGVTFS